jgi:hypothetical protein
MMPAQALDFKYSCQASAEHFQQCAEFSAIAALVRSHAITLSSTDFIL